MGAAAVECIKAVSYLSTSNIVCGVSSVLACAFAIDIGKNCMSKKDRVFKINSLICTSVISVISNLISYPPEGKWYEAIFKPLFWISTSLFV